jgi:hypothetical protein
MGSFPVTCNLSGMFSVSFGMLMLVGSLLILSSNNQ